MAEQTPSAPTGSGTALTQPGAGRALRAEVGLFRPAAVVLEEQRAALAAIGAKVRTQGRSDLPISMRGRSLLIGLAIDVLAHAAVATVDQCRTIVAAAEAQAAGIVAKARDDVDRLTSWLDEPGPATEEVWGDSPSDDLVMPLPSPPPLPASGFTDPDSEAGNEFFGPDATSNDDPWSFMDDDDLVGVGPSILKLVRRRPSPPRPPNS
jgi:hypothetical protein